MASPCEVKEEREDSANVPEGTHLQFRMASPCEVKEEREDSPEIPSEKVYLPRHSYKRKDLSLREKVVLINNSQGKSYRKLAEQFNIGKTQVGNILKRKAEICTQYEKSVNPDRKRICQSTEFTNLDETIFAWFNEIRSLNIPVSGPMIQTKALEVAKELGINDFKASGGWLARFKSRHCLTGNKNSSKKITVQEDMVKDWLDKLASLLEGYDVRDIFNMSEAGIFYRALPDRTLTGKAYRKKPKERLTVCLCVNMAGEFETPLVIGTTARPSCFGNLDPGSLPVIWRANKEAWMERSIFQEWLQTFDQLMASQGRRVILLLDNALSHSHDLLLSSVQLVYLPSNAKAVLQPLDLGIIQAVKLHYRQKLLEYVIIKADSIEEPTRIMKAVDVHLAIHWLHDSINAVKASTVEKSFLKAGVKPTSGAPIRFALDEDSYNIYLGELIKKTERALRLPEPLALEEYQAIDDGCPSHDPQDDDWESCAVQPSMQTEAQVEEEEDEEEAEAPGLTDAEAQEMLNRLRTHFLRKNYSASLELLMATIQQFSNENCQ